MHYRQDSPARGAGHGDILLQSQDDVPEYGGTPKLARLKLD
jgi:hypothetical protein